MKRKRQSKISEIESVGLHGEKVLLRPDVGFLAHSPEASMRTNFDGYDCNGLLGGSALEFQYEEDVEVEATLTMADATLVWKLPPITEYLGNPITRFVSLGSHQLTTKMVEWISQKYWLTLLSGLYVLNSSSDATPRTNLVIQALGGRRSQPRSKVSMILRSRLII